MSSKPVVCGPCNFSSRRKDAHIWCTVCEEGFCEGCENVHTSAKISRNHKIIPVEDYQKIADLSISQICETHGKKLELYCKSHNEPLCVMCVPTNHNSCSDVVDLDDVVKHAKRSTALNDLEDTVDRTIKNLTYNINDRNLMLKDIDSQGQTIKVQLRETREKINKHLDHLEKNILFDLANKSDQCKSKSSKNHKFFESTRKKLQELKQKITQLKNFASNLQVFLGTRQIGAVVTDHMKSMAKEVNTAKNYKFKVHLHSSVDSLLGIKDLGKIECTESKSNLQIQEAKVEQAQIPVVKSQDVRGMSVRLLRKFHVKKKSFSMQITGCIILPNGHILIADYHGQKQLMEYNNKGEHIRDIPVSSQPYDMTVIDTERIAVSYGQSGYIEIINIKSNVMEKKIDLGNFCHGISYQDGKIYTVVYNEGVVIVDMTGRTLNTINWDVRNVIYLTTTKDRIYYTDIIQDTVHCCSMTGEEIWVFNDPSIKYPLGISVDNNQNVYVVGHTSHNLTVIQHDGTVSKTLLTEDDELDEPRAVYYDKDKKVLCVCDDDSGNAALYDII